MKTFSFIALMFLFAACKKSGSDTPEPGSTREFTVDIRKFDEGRAVINSNTSTPSCQTLYAVEFAEDQHAISYSVNFYDLQKSGGGLAGVVDVPDFNVVVTMTDTVQILNRTVGNIAYTNWYHVGSGKSITRKPAENKINVSPNFWCAGEGVCNPANSCQTMTGKAKVIVQY